MDYFRNYRFTYLRLAQRCFNDLFLIEILFDMRSACKSRCTLFVIGHSDKAFQRVIQCVCIVNGHYDARYAVFDSFFAAVHIGGDKRSRTCGAFEQRI